MTPLRQRMIEAMQLRGLSERTQESSLAVVQQLALDYGKSPDLLTEADLRAYFLYLRNEKQLAPNTTNVALNALKFFYTYTLHRPRPLRDLIRPPIPKFDFIHLVDKTRKAGYAWITPDLQERVNHARPANGHYTRAAPV